MQREGGGMKGIMGQMSKCQTTYSLDCKVWYDPEVDFGRSLVRLRGEEGEGGSREGWRSGGVEGEQGIISKCD